MHTEPFTDVDVPPRILSVRIDLLNFQQVIIRIRQFLKQEYLHSISTVNPEFVVTAQTDREFLSILNHADLNVVDGTGVQLALRMFRRRVCERISGVDLTWALARLAAEEGYSIFLLGAASGVACEAARRLKGRYPDLSIAGCYSGSPDEPGIVERINEARPDILLVAFGAPKQEKFIFRNRKKLQAKVAMGVGGTFDYIAGVVPRAPLWMRRIGMEWLHRLIRQPQRLRRIIKATVEFPLALVHQELTLKVVSIRMFGTLDPLSESRR